MREASPYRTLWETAAFVADFLAGRVAATDPLWPANGAESATGYARWAEHLCGCACLQMALGARGPPVPHIQDIPRAVPALGGYVERPDGTIRGLIDAGAVAWLDQRLAPKIFARFFAGRGILIPGSLRSA